MMGYYFSLARFHEGGQRREFLAKSLAVPILFHGAYDFLLFYMEASSDNILLVAFLLILFAGFIILLWRKGLAKIKHHLELDGKLLEE
jgi:hypothetical protein